MATRSQRQNRNTIAGSTLNKKKLIIKSSMISAAPADMFTNLREYSVKANGRRVAQLNPLW